MSAETWPRLTETLTGPRDPRRCQSCGLVGEIGIGLRAWREHDMHDAPEARVVVLCQPCADSLIEPALRLYEPLTLNAPFPGIHGICLDCIHRKGVACAHPDLRANGGPGLELRQQKPHVVFMDGTRGGRRAGWQQLVYPKEPSECVGREVKP